MRDRRRNQAEWWQANFYRGSRVRRIWDRSVRFRHSAGARPRTSVWRPWPCCSAWSCSPGSASTDGQRPAASAGSRHRL